jgi:phage/plasmid-associated DNA primase
LVLLRFARKFSDDEKNPHLEHQLLSERDGILMWLVEGARLYLKNGICMSPSMKAELATYRKESDLLGEFLQDHTAPDPAGRLPQSSLYDSYRGWCLRAGVRSLSKKSFTQRLAERGYPEAKSGSSRYYAGLTWAEPVPLFAQRDVGGVDGISAISGNSSHENLTLEKYPNSTTSRPTCPNPSPQPGAPL